MYVQVGVDFLSTNSITTASSPITSERASERAGELKLVVLFGQLVTDPAIRVVWLQ